MKTGRKILIAFLMNLGFSVFEMIGGLLTGSVAILSDAVHDMGDAASIGLSYILERKSKQAPDAEYTYGYARYSVIGAVITTCILLLGSAMVISHAVRRMIHSGEIHYNGMIVFAVVGMMINVGAAVLTHHGDSLNEKAVNLHMLEDALGWIVVLIGSVVMKLTGFVLIDPIMSIGISVFILVHAVKNLRESMEIFLEKAPQGVEIEAIRKELHTIEGVLDVHHVHVWSMDGRNHYATMHIVTDSGAHPLKERIRETLSGFGICHVTLELEGSGESCASEDCHIEVIATPHHHHHHHHSHHGCSHT